MRPDHRQALEEIFDQADLVQARYVEQVRQRRAEWMDFKYALEDLIETTVEPTFLEFQKYLHEKGMPSFIEHLEADDFDPLNDDISHTTFYRFTVGIAAEPGGQMGFLNVVGDLSARDVWLNWRLRGESVATKVQPVDGDPGSVDSITDDLLHKQFRELMRCILLQQQQPS